MKPFEESMRYEYDLTPNSVVLDCGGYRGDFAAEINRRYGCIVLCYEPVSRMSSLIKERFKNNDSIFVSDYAIGGERRSDEFKVKGDMTGVFADGVAVPVTVWDIAKVAEGFECADLIKLNIEGMEFEVLERIISAGIVGKFRNIQVQWHDVAANAQERFDELQKRLSETHELTFDAGWVWQNWRLKA